MSGKLSLGKTKDSRTRAQSKMPENETLVSRLMQELKQHKDLAAWLLSKGFSVSTVRRYICDTEAFLKWTRAQTIPHEFIVYPDVLHYIQTIKKKVNQRTVSTRLNSLKHYFNFLEKTEQREENPAMQIKIRGIKRKILYDILSHQELESLYNQYHLPSEDSKDRNQNWFISSLLASKRNKIVLGLMVYQGLNSCELGRLTEKDMKLREGKIYIAGSRRSNARELKLEAHQVLDIMEYLYKVRPEMLLRTGKSSDKLFISAGSSEEFRSIICKLMKKLHQQNSKVTSINQIRTSVITHWLKLYNLRQVQHMSGHRFVSSTESYKINDLADLQEEILRYHPLG